MTTAFLALLIAGLAGAVVGLLWVAGRQNVVADESAECCPPATETPRAGDGDAQRAA